ncbi:hypothetical protein SCALM49S_04340 [Streptomyces californicus]
MARTSTPLTTVLDRLQCRGPPLMRARSFRLSGRGRASRVTAKDRSAAAAASCTEEAAARP